MSFLHSALTLPTYGEAFKASKTASVVDNANDGSASPPHKRIRLDPDSDDAPSRTRTTTSGPVKLQLVGAPPVADKGLQHGQLQSKEVAAWVRGLLLPEPDIRATNEQIYSQCRYVVQVCGLGEDLYGRIKDEIQRSVTDSAKQLRVQGDVDLDWVAKLVEHCARFEKNMRLVQSLLTYLNQSYARTHGKESTQDFGLRYFRQYLMLDSSIQRALSASIKRWIAEERGTKDNVPHAQRPVFVALFKHLQAHGLYPDYEEEYCALTREYYTAESERLAKELDARAFLEHVLHRIEVEVDRARAVLSVGSWAIVRRATEESLCKGRLQWIAAYALGVLVDRDEKDKLKEVYELFSRVDGLPKLNEVWKDYVKDKVTAIVTDVANDDKMVDRLLQFKNHANRIVEECFLTPYPEDKLVPEANPEDEHEASDKEDEASSSVIPARAPNQSFVYALTDAFGKGFQARKIKPAEMIARYLDSTLRKGQKGKSDKEFEAGLDAALSLYKYTDDKDVFRTFYHRALAKRLLLQKSASDDFEIAMLKKLKEHYDPEFGMGEEMFKDLALSRDMMLDFHDKLPANDLARRLTVMVLQRSAWPFTVSKSTIDLPPKMQDALSEFTKYYKGKHQGRVLDWDHALGTATLTARFDAGEKELSVSLYQAVVLLMFVDVPKRTFAEVKELAGKLDDGDLRRTLQSLACGKKRVLLKVPPGKDVHNGDVFQFNAEFTDSQRRVHINSIQAKVSAEESQKTQYTIEGERKHILDAAIVRIMKGKKELTLQELQSSVIAAVAKHFIPDVKKVKGRIEAMVEQEYIERVPEKQNTFRYVA